ncbi:hypothetical protein Glo7428_3144 [Gloeocapsa sp. PCC 7428]|uniref:hypothetical protein n=1 Tax=Gloeocapsa sp. PCC 7428 TaxID=1173026 RepID=UPI0002A5EF11|nr:hypothetical protein [Gloeocapsa sp. PCC 7428]AFZ31631.1 hypothetical protein Glo7428_3144 [Gloeocapsa sp. PCC 7428]
MPISSVNRARSIVIPLTVNSGSSIIPIYRSSELTVGSELIPDHTIVNYNCFFKNLKAFAEISSLPEASLPNFKLEDSDTDKLYKVLDVEWNSPRKQMTLYISPTGNNLDWSKVGSISMLNPSGYPYRIYNLMDLFTDNLALELGENSAIGIGIDDVGYGLLETIDKVTIHGSYVEEIFVQYTEPQPIVNLTVPERQPIINVNITSAPINTGGGQDGGNGLSTLIGNNTLVGNEFLIAN